MDLDKITLTFAKKISPILLRKYNKIIKNIKAIDS
jgi:hypothetical protein